MSNPDWFVLIDQWSKKKLGAYGVTLPFLLGALDYKAGTKTIGASDIRALLEEMINHPVEGYQIEGRWCPDIDAPVFSVAQINSPYHIHIKSSLPRPDGRGVAIAFSLDLHSGLGCSEAKECIEKLVSYSSEYVENGNFSRNYCETSKSYEYGPFSEKDLKFITETIMDGMNA